MEWFNLIRNFPNNFIVFYIRAAQIIKSLVELTISEIKSADGFLHELQE